MDGIIQEKSKSSRKFSGYHQELKSILNKLQRDYQ